MDPKKLLEKAFLKPDQFITEIQISTFQGEDIFLGWSTNLSTPTFKIVDFVFDHLTFEKHDPKITFIKNHNSSLGFKSQMPHLPFFMN